MKNIFVNFPQKLLILIVFALTYIPVLYFTLYNNFNNILVGDAAKSLTFIWTVFLLTLINLLYCLVVILKKNSKGIRFLIKTNIEYGKIYSGLFLTAFIFLVQSAIVNRHTLISYWYSNKSVLYSAVSVSVLAFLIFPAIAAVINYYLVKYFRKAFWISIKSSIPISNAQKYMT